MYGVFVESLGGGGWSSGHKWTRFGKGGKASDVRTYDMFNGGRCFQGELRGVLSVDAVVLATDAAAERTAENLVASLPYLRGLR